MHSKQFTEDELFVINEVLPASIGTVSNILCNLEFGETDEGDPFVVVTSETGEAVGQLAKIDGKIMCAVQLEHLDYPEQWFDTIWEFVDFVYNTYYLRVARLWTLKNALDRSITRHVSPSAADSFVSQPREPIEVMLSDTLRRFTDASLIKSNIQDRRH